MNWSYPGVLVHSYMDFLLWWGLNKHLIPLPRCITMKQNRQYYALPLDYTWEFFVLDPKFYKGFNLGNISNHGLMLCTEELILVCRQRQATTLAFFIVFCVCLKWNITHQSNLFPFVWKKRRFSDTGDYVLTIKLTVQSWCIWLQWCWSRQPRGPRCQWKSGQSPPASPVGRKRINLNPAPQLPQHCIFHISPISKHLYPHLTW